MNRVIRLGLLLGILLLGFVMVGWPQKKDKSTGSTELEKALENRSKSVTTKYTIQPEDTVEVVVRNERELSRTVTVRPDGKITLPLVQDIQAAGLSPLELKEQLEKRLKEYIEFPTVTVMVDAINSYKVYFVGKVANQGVMTLLQPVTVLQGLALAGGLEEFAKQDEITIVRGSDKETKVYPFNYKDIIKGKNLSQNVVLEPGDVVIIP